jgi:hypothetical protein
MTPRAQRLLRLNSHVSPIALTRGVDDHCCIAKPSNLPAPPFPMRWKWVGRVEDMALTMLPKAGRSGPGWPCRADEFIQEYAGSLVGVA